MNLIGKPYKTHIFRAIGLFGAALVVSTGLSACQDGNSAGGDKAVNPQNTAFQDKPVAKLGDDVIFYSDVYRTARAQGLIGPNEAQKRQDGAAPMPESPMDIAVFNQVLDSLLDRKLLAKDAVRRKDFDNPLDERRLEAAREQLLSSIRMEAHLRETVTEDAMRALYTRQTELAARGDEIHVQHILVEDEEGASRVLERLDKGDAFDSLAAELSQDKATRDRGGDLDYVTYDMLPPDFAKAVFSAQPKGKPFSFETKNGWQVAQILGRRNLKTQSYEDSREALRRFLTFEAIEALLSDLRGKADVTFMGAQAPKSSEPSEPRLRKP